MIELTRWRDALLLILMALYFLLNYGFMLVRIGPVPVGELALAASLLLIDHRKTLPRFVRSPLMIPFLAWLAIGGFHMGVGLFQDPFWTIRDASNVIESLFLYVGFAFAGNRLSMAALHRWLPRVFWLIALYSLTYPFRETLMPFSPIISNASGRDIPLLFLFTNSGMLLTIGAAYYLRRHLDEGPRRFLTFAVIMVTEALLLFPSRTLYLQLIFLMAYFLLTGGWRQMRRLVLVSALPVALMAVILGSGVSIYGRFGDDFTMSDYVALFMEIFGHNDPEASISSGNELRLLWWAQILSESTQSWAYTLWGRGFGFPLVDFAIAGGVQVREPHNDFISVFARMGIFGLGAFLMIQAYLIALAIRVSRRAKSHPREAALTLCFLLLLIDTLITSLGEPPFSLSFFAIPYYFIGGVVLRLNSIREEARRAAANLPYRPRAAISSLKPSPALAAPPEGASAS